MRYDKLLKDLGMFSLQHIAVVTISLEDHFRYIERLSTPEIKRSLETRGGDVSVGSTYIIDLVNNISYRFKNHDTLKTNFPFHGFIPYGTTGKIFKYRNFDGFQKILPQLIVREGKQEIHDSTPIRLLTVIPTPVANLSIRVRNLNPVREYERRFIQQKRVPDPGEPINIKDARVPIIA